MSVTDKKIWPHIFLAAGLVLLMAGFVYDVIFAGIPYQDPTPEMAARYAHHASTANMLYWFGGLLLLIGLISVIVRSLFDRFR
jgi:uncharacterized membrane protein